MKEKKTALIIGGNGLLGYGMVKRLFEKQWNVRSLDICETPEEMRIMGVDYIIGNLFDESVLKEAIKGVGTVFYLISSTIPKTNDAYLENEIEKTLTPLDYVLRVMSNNDIRSFVFPSSGGAIYGDTLGGSASENTELAPKTAYGTGKLLCEQALKFYYNKHGISSQIFRIGNVYGSPLYRSRQQGVIDVFIQDAIAGKPVTIWGNAKAVVRDYIILDDVTDAIERVAAKGLIGVNIYNVGCGVGATLQDIIDCINQVMERPFEVNYDKGISSGIDRIVLNISKIQKELNWSPSFDLVSGIRTTVELKMRLFRNKIDAGD